MLHIRAVSDLHLEHYYDLYESATRAKEELSRLIPPLPTDKKTVLIVAGDLATASRSSRIKTFFRILAPRFKHIIYVLGNHEHYGMYMDHTQIVIEDAIESVLGEEYENKVTVAGNEPKYKVIKDVTFLLGTLWTDYGATQPNVEFIRRAIKNAITDHRIIETDDGMATPELLAEIHQNTVKQFSEWLAEDENSKTVVVTHHMPSMQAVHPMYRSDPGSMVLNHAFATDLDEMIHKFAPAYWFFGHTHTKFFGKIGETQLHCNPGGYPHERAMLGPYDSTMVYSL